MQTTFYNMLWTCVICFVSFPPPQHSKKSEKNRTKQSNEVIAQLKTVSSTETRRHIQGFVAGNQETAKTAAVAISECTGVVHLRTCIDRIKPSRLFTRFADIITTASRR